MPQSPQRKREYMAEYQKRPENVKKRVMRNAARRELEREGLVHKGDGKDVDHKKPLELGGSNSRSNLRVRSRSTNRGWRKGKSSQTM